MGCTFQPLPEPLPPLSMCPFCGSKAVELADERVQPAAAAVYVLCKCGAQGPARHTVAEAVMFWNERRF